MIKIDEKNYSSMEEAMPFFEKAVDIWLDDLPLVTAIPDLPVAVNVWLDNLPLAKDKRI